MLLDQAQEIRTAWQTGNGTKDPAPRKRVDVKAYRGRTVRSKGDAIIAPCPPIQSRSGQSFLNHSKSYTTTFVQSALLFSTNSKCWG